MIGVGDQADIFNLVQNIVPFFLLFLFCFVFMLSLGLCRLDVPLMFSYPTDHVVY